MSNALTRIEPTPVRSTSASTDEQLIELWLADKRSKSAATEYLYGLTIRQFFEVVPKTLAQIRLEDLRLYEQTLQSYRPATRAQRIATIKSLLTFAHKVGYTPFNVGAAIKPETWKGTLSERILTEDQVAVMFAACQTEREELLLRLLYLTGGRVSEIVGATWKDLIWRDDRAQICLFGKGKKTRYVLIPAKLYWGLMRIRDGAGDDEKIFPLTRFRVWQIVRKVAERVGITTGVSPHWFRHAHATHALQRGAPLKLVSETLGHASILITDRYLHIRPGESSGDYLDAG
jgi:integrase/recombinase XerD